MTTPEYIRKAAIASVLADLVADPDRYLAREFAVQPRAMALRELADRLYAIATEEGS